MQFVFTSKAAKKLARSLEKHLKSIGITLTHGQAAETLAAVQGFNSWNALSAKISEVGITEQLDDFELRHIEDNEDTSYGTEVEIRTHTGFALRYDGVEDLCSYVRVVDPLGREIAYWVCDEWQEDPQVVMGAILGALARGRPMLPAPSPRKMPSAVRVPWDETRQFILGVYQNLSGWKPAALKDYGLNIILEDASALLDKTEMQDATLVSGKTLARKPIVAQDFEEVEGYTVATWQQEVAAGNTRLGYQDWACAQRN